jgi:DNA-directed RNA polymerase subunit M/transcription elongation factor TFIIS
MVVFFCENCKNIMKFKHEDSKTHLECCSCLRDNPLSENSKSNIVYKESKINNEYPVSLNTKYDRTLMRTTAYQCKNEECPSKIRQANPMVISYARNKNLVQGYMCTECDACWY